MSKQFREYLNSHAPTALAVFTVLKAENGGKPPTLIEWVIRVSSTLAGMMPTPLKSPTHTLTCPTGKRDPWGFHVPGRRYDNVLEP